MFHGEAGALGQGGEGQAGSGHQGLRHRADGRVELPFVSGGAQHHRFVGALQSGAGRREDRTRPPSVGTSPMYGRDGAGRLGSRASMDAANSGATWGWSDSETSLRSCSAYAARSAGPATMGTPARRVGAWRSCPAGHIRKWWPVAGVGPGDEEHRNGNRRQARPVSMGALTWASVGPEPSAVVLID